MLNNEHVQEKFLNAYDASADDIFEYCMSQTQHRDIAKYLTRNIFVESWDTIVRYGFESVSTIKHLLFRTAKDHVREFRVGERNQVAFQDRLWNLTLSQ